MITGSVIVDLSSDPGENFTRDRHRLAVLEHCPAGARVIVDIGSRTFVTHDAAVWLHEHDHRLSIEIRGSDPQAVLRFVLAGREGDWSVVA